MARRPPGGRTRSGHPQQGKCHRTGRVFEVQTHEIQHQSNTPGVVSSPDTASANVLLLVQAVVAGLQGDRTRAREALDAAEKIARQLQPDQNDYDTEFNLTNVQLHRVAIATDLGDAGEAIDIAKTMNADRLSHERQMRLQLDLARRSIVSERTPGARDGGRRRLCGHVASHIESDVGCDVVEPLGHWDDPATMVRRPPVLLDVEVDTVDDVFERATVGTGCCDQGLLGVEEDRRSLRLGCCAAPTNCVDNDVLDHGAAQRGIVRVADDVVGHAHATLTRMTDDGVDGQGRVRDRGHTPTMTENDGPAPGPKVCSLPAQLGDRPARQRSPGCRRRFDVHQPHVRSRDVRQPGVQPGHLNKGRRSRGAAIPPVRRSPAYSPDTRRSRRSSRPPPAPSPCRLTSRSVSVARAMPATIASSKPTSDVALITVTRATDNMTPPCTCHLRFVVGVVVSLRTGTCDRWITWPVARRHARSVPS